MQESEKWNEAADVKTKETADIVAQFKERYRIARYDIQNLIRTEYLVSYTSLYEAVTSI